MVSVLIFAMGAGISLYEGAMRILAPTPIEAGALSWAVLAISFAFGTGATAVALRGFKARHAHVGWFEAAVISKDRSSFMILFTNIAAVVGVVLAAAGLFASKTWNEPVFDGAASIAIGPLLAAVCVTDPVSGSTLLASALRLCSSTPRGGALCAAFDPSSNGLGPFFPRGRDGAARQQRETTVTILFAQPYESSPSGSLKRLT